MLGKGSIINRAFRKFGEKSMRTFASSAFRDMGKHSDANPYSALFKFIQSKKEGFQKTLCESLDCLPEDRAPAKKEKPDTEAWSQRYNVVLQLKSVIDQDLQDVSKGVEALDKLKLNDAERVQEYYDFMGEVLPLISKKEQNAGFGVNVSFELKQLSETLDECHTGLVDKLSEYEGKILLHKQNHLFADSKSGVAECQKVFDEYNETKNNIERHPS